MNACHKNRKSLALLAAGALDPSQSASLRQHIDECLPCRRHFEELTRTCAALGETELPTVEYDAANFHRRLVRMVTPRSSAGSNAMMLWGRWRPRLIASAAVFVLVALAFVCLQIPSRERRTEVSSGSETVPESEASVLSPSPAQPASIAYYRSLAVMSLAALDAALAAPESAPYGSRQTELMTLATLSRQEGLE